MNSSYQYSFNSRGGTDCSCSVSESEYRNAVRLCFMTTPRAPIMALTDIIEEMFSIIYR
jgi:hypothetical protein